MTNTLNPLIAQLHAAETHQDVAQLLLRMPDSIVLKFSSLIIDTCRKRDFEPGALFVNTRIAGLLAVRDANGLLSDSAARSIDSARRELVAFVTRGKALHAAETIAAAIIDTAAGFQTTAAPPTSRYRGDGPSPTDL